MLQYPGVQIVQGQNATTQISGYPDTQCVVVYNESPFFLQVTLNGSGTYGLAAYTADCFQVFSGFSGGVTFMPTQYIALSSGSPPASIAFIQAYGANEPLTRLIQHNQATGYPISLNRLQNIGNSIALGQTATNIVNDGNAANTNIIESTVTGASGPSTVVTNDGLWTLKVLIAGALHQFLKTNTTGNLLQLGNANDNVEMLSQIITDLGITMPQGQAIAWNTGGFLGNIVGGSGGQMVYNSSGSSHQFLLGGNVLSYTLDGTGIKLTSGKQLVFGTGHEITDCYGISGTGSGTFSTGAPNNSLFLAFDPCTVSGSSQSIGATRAASTVVTTFSGLAWSATVITF